MEDSKRVLLVDDEPEICVLYKDLLETYGYSIETRSSGNSALEYLNDNQVDLVISDICMEDGDGLFLTGELKKKEIPVILMSGFFDCTRKEALKHGASELFLKPINIAELVNSMQLFFKKKG